MAHTGTQGAKVHLGESLFIAPVVPKGAKWPVIRSATDVGHRLEAGKVSHSLLGLLDAASLTTREFFQKEICYLQMPRRLCTRRHHI